MVHQFGWFDPRVIDFGGVVLKIDLPIIGPTFMVEPVGPPGQVQFFKTMIITMHVARLTSDR